MHHRLIYPNDSSPGITLYVALFSFILCEYLFFEQVQRVSRHVNYLGEIGMATGLTLALGYRLQLAIWLYSLYYVALLVPRQIADDRRCAEKSGALWKEYVTRMPYRVLPGTY